MKKKKDVLFIIALFVISLYRLKLLKESSWELILSTGYDDIMQMKNAVTMTAGDWLGGSYFYTSMAKNVGYPLFLAIGQWLNISYGFLYGAVIIFASLIFVKAISPIFSSRKLLLLMYVIILFAPINHEAFYRIYRNALVPWIFLLVLSCMIALFIRHKEKVSKQIPWSIGAMASIMYFWILREDSIWIFPFVFTASIMIIIVNLPLVWSHRREFIHKTLLALLPLSGIIAVSIITSAINYSHYGIWAMNDRTQTYAPKAMSLIYRIDDGRTKDKDVWASRESMRLAINESPTLRKIGDRVLASYNLWAGGEELELKGDISQWSLRFAVEEEGYYHGNARKTNTFYKKVYEELTEAFRSGKLHKKSGIYLSSQTGAFHISDFLQSTYMALALSRKISNYCNTQVSDRYLIYQDFSETDLTFFENILNTDLPRTSNQLTNLDVNKKYNDYDLNLTTFNNISQKNNEYILLNRKKAQKKENLIAIIYQMFSYICLPLSFLGYYFLILDIVKQRNLQQSITLFLIMTGAALSAFLNIFLVCLFSRWITTDLNSIIYGFYASAAYLLYTITMLIGTIAVAKKLRELVNNPY
ncbi:MULTISPECIES: hypothetical protein [Streptococcus]|uniref:hypothetical protein n=1 Tax=Streptococcus TaxID=1301 RepID=UPI000EC005C4|nr:MULTISPECIES: hypothetical protein [Streptococcus]MBT0904377.1 hypothetical protein [Streptococcus infantarius subsp. infantarius]MBT0918290.1 hypothetical protein [Streptococcus infantarius subsp. infantarius]MCO4572566.1 hypothetical protein [Streptococcus infantarius subsp. infantarius]MCO4588500.1 hypothetical protein [Streptococcus infantarius subsp. infantarius]HAK39732.1 hypothetical protein [Streptococcus sp.]